MILGVWHINSLTLALDFSCLLLGLRVNEQLGVTMTHIAICRKYRQFVTKSSKVQKLLILNGYISKF